MCASSGPSASRRTGLLNGLAPNSNEWARNIAPLHCTVLYINLPLSRRIARTRVFAVVYSRVHGTLLCCTAMCASLRSVLRTVSAAIANSCRSRSVSTHAAALIKRHYLRGQFGKPLFSSRTCLSESVRTVSIVLCPRRVVKLVGSRRERSMTCFLMSFTLHNHN